MQIKTTVKYYFKLIRMAITNQSTNNKCCEVVEKRKPERKKELIPFATAWMELEIIMLSEISQVVKVKYHMISPLRGT